MKKYFLLLASLFLFAIVNSNFTYAQELTQAPIQATPTPTPTPKYTLAYPGILPDHPLYKLKVLRDRISVSLMSDPQKKIDFYLLQADKGLLATAMLVDKNTKIELIEDTALKAEHNMTMVSNTIRTLSNKPDNKLFDELKAASFKHQEIIKSIIAKLPKNKQKTFDNVLEFSKRNLESIERKQKKDSARWNDWADWN